MNISNLPNQNQNVIEITLANGERKKGYKPGHTGKDRSLMIATYGTFGKDNMTSDDAILFAENAIKDHEREIKALKKLRFQKTFERYSSNVSELEDIVALIKEKQAKAADNPTEE